MPAQTVLLAGATGMLGVRIAEHLLDADGVAVRLLVRQRTLDDPEKRQQIDSLVERGAEVVVGDVSDPASLAAATRGVDVVISALQGGREIIVDGQVALARAAVANGVRRMLPSDFALDHFKATPGEHSAFDLRREADRQIADLDIEQVNVLGGAFLDGAAAPGAMVDFDDAAGTATFWGEGDEQFEATTVADTARYAARVALDPDIKAESSRSPPTASPSTRSSPRRSARPDAAMRRAAAATSTISEHGSRRGRRTAITARR